MDVDDYFFLEARELPLLAKSNLEAMAFPILAVLLFLVTTPCRMDDAGPRDQKGSAMFTLG